MTDINDVTAVLEAMIDKHGLLHVLTGLELVCAEKAELIRHARQDKATARPWDAAGRAIRAAADKISI